MKIPTNFTTTPLSVHSIAHEISTWHMLDTFTDLLAPVRLKSLLESQTGCGASELHFISIGCCKMGTEVS